MLTVELIKSIRNRTYCYILLTVLISYALGYILPIGIDKVSQLGIEDFYFSTYTVFTQFGFLIFGFVIVYFVNKDFSDKTILLNFFGGCNSLSFLFIKVSVLFVEFVFSIVIANLVASSIFRFDSFYFLFTTIIFSLIILQYILIISTIGILFSNMLVAIGISLLYWLITIILVAAGEGFEIAAVFDASNFLYHIVEEVLSKGELINIMDFFVVLPYISMLLFLSILVGIAATKRWLKNGL